MKQKQLFLSTLREIPADAEVTSHQLLLRAGFIRQFTAGVYTFLPLGLRVLQKIETIVREEMDAAGAQEILMPALQTQDLWEESGRFEDLGQLMFRLTDRHDRKLVLGPTHEEVITTLVRDEIRSYRQLPVNLYQIQTKFRDEGRPRAGLLRVREFRMKDAYSFDLDKAGLDATYQSMYDAYRRVFDRLGIAYRAVDADPGAIGGDGGTHEFMVLSDAGEDTIAGCSGCDYAANIEKASGKGLPRPEGGAVPDRDRMATPGVKTIEAVVNQLGVSATQVIKVVVYIADGQPVAACVRGDHEVNDVKLKNILGARQLEIATHDQVLEATGRPVGFVGPDVAIRKIFDRDVLTVLDGVAAFAEGTHDIHVVPGRDFDVPVTHDIRNVVSGDACAQCGHPLQFYRGIEVGHIFKLGTKYSETFHASYLDESGADTTIQMGCYGLGVSRIIAATVEQCNDENGIVWPVAITPYHVHIVPVSVRDEAQMRVATTLYQRLRAAGIDVLLDDRDERPGVKFKDADLIGLPVRVTIGNKVADGLIEWKLRKTGEVQVATVEQTFEAILGVIK